MNAELGRGTNNSELPLRPSEPHIFWDERTSERPARRTRLEAGGSERPSDVRQKRRGRSRVKRGTGASPSNCVPCHLHWVFEVL